MKRIDLWFQSELPISIDTSLSWYQALCQLGAKLNELVDAYNKIDVENVYSKDNPPPYPVLSVNGKTGAVQLTIADIPDAVSDEELGALRTELQTYVGAQLKPLSDKQTQLENQQTATAANVVKAMADITRLQATTKMMSASTWDSQHAANVNTWYNEGTRIVFVYKADSYTDETYIADIYALDKIGQSETASAYQLNASQVLIVEQNVFDQYGTDAKKALYSNHVRLLVVKDPNGGQVLYALTVDGETLPIGGSGGEGGAVLSVNGKVGNVVITAASIGAALDTELNAAEQRLESLEDWHTKNQSNIADIPSIKSTANEANTAAQAAQAEATSAGKKADAAKSAAETADAKATAAQAAADKAVKTVYGAEPDEAGDAKPEIGGTNLLASSDGLTKMSITNATKTTGESDPFGGNNAVKFTATEDDAYALQLNVFNQQSGKYTLSFWGKSNKQYEMRIFQALNSRVGNASLTTEWKKFTLTFTFTAIDDRYDRIYFGGLNSFNTGDEFTLFNIKLERGVVPTDWSPAPEDKVDTETEIALTGAVNGSASLQSARNEISTIRRGCTVGINSPTSNNLWYKFASVNLNTSNHDYFIIFLVDTAGYSDKPERTGILIAHVRTSSTTEILNKGFVWLVAGNEINPDDFVMASSNKANSTVELWVTVSSYECYSFTVLTEGRREARENNTWTLHSGIALVNSGTIDEGLDQLKSTLITIKNSTVSENLVSSVNGQTGQVNLTASDVNAVPTTRTVNNKPLSDNVNLTAGDVNAVPTTRTVNNKPLSNNINLTAADVGAPTVTAFDETARQALVAYSPSNPPPAQIARSAFNAQKWNGEDESVTITATIKAENIVGGLFRKTGTTMWFNSTKYPVQYSQGSGNLTIFFTPPDNWNPWPNATMDIVLFYLP